MSNKPIRILQCGMTDNYGGVEAFIMNVYRNIDKSKVQFDFLTLHDKKIVCEDEIKKMGGRIFKVEYSKKDNLIKHYTALNTFFKQYANEFVGIHMNSCFPNYSLPLKYAKKYNINIRIFHSHNSEDMYKSKYIIVELMKKVKYFFEKKMIKKRATSLLACSDEAGNYMFDKSEFKVIKNGVDLEKFRYNENIRKEIRKELNLRDEIVIGFVGRLQYQKNPLFALEIIKKINEKNTNYKLLMVGSGILESKIKEYIEINKLNANVILLGQRNDVYKLYQAMDIFLLPSNFEGLGIVLIEAQAAGLRCITSDNVPLLTKVTNNISYYNLEELNSWVDSIIEIPILQTNREKAYEEVNKKGFGIRNTIKELTGIYHEGNE